MANDILKTPFDSTQLAAIESYINNKINISTGGYSVYIANVTQADTSVPVPTVMQNTIGSLVWSYNSTGNYSITLANAFPTQDKVIIFVNNAVINTQTSVYWADTDTITVETLTLAGSPADNHLTNVSIEIRVYP